ncbi:MAG: PorV/PorQ family protein [Fidelibacterota bacterium]
MIWRLLVTAWCLASVAAASEIGGQAGAFLRLGSTARSIAVGGGLTGAVEEGFAAYHNPAAVAFLEKRHLSVFHHFLPLDRYLVSASFSSSLPPTGGVGVAVVSAGVEDIEGRDGSGHRTGTFSTEDYALYFSFSNRILESVSVGVNVKLIYQIIPLEGRQASRGVGVDIGVMVRRFEKLDLGLVIEDLNTAYVWNTSGLYEERGRTYQDPFPLQVRLGVGYHPGPIDVMGDYTYFSFGKSLLAHRVRAGGEYRPMPQVAIRAGMNNFFPTVGVGLNYSLLKRNDARVDYAFLLGRRGEGISHVLSYVFAF